MGSTIFNTLWNIVFLEYCREKNSSPIVQALLCSSKLQTKSSRVERYMYSPIEVRRYKTTCKRQWGRRARFDRALRLDFSSFPRRFMNWKPPRSSSFFTDVGGRGADTHRLEILTSTLVGPRSCATFNVPAAHLAALSSNMTFTSKLVKGQRA